MFIRGQFTLGIPFSIQEYQLITSEMSGISYIVLGKRRSALFTTCKRCATKLHEPERQVQFEKSCRAYWHQIAREITLLPIQTFYKHHRESRETKFWKHAWVICTCVTTLQSCYTGMPSFSASQKRVIINNVIKYLSRISIIIIYSTKYRVSDWSMMNA